MRWGLLRVSRTPSNCGAYYLATLTGADIVRLLALSRTTNGRPPEAADAQRAAGLLAAIDERFAAEPDGRYRAALANFERHPARHQAAFRRLLDDLLARDPAFAARVKQLASPPPAPRPIPAAAPPAARPAATGPMSAPRSRPSRRGALAGPPPLPGPLAELCARLTTFFNLDELRDLALDLHLNPQEIPDATLPQYARGLILRCWRDGTLDALPAAAARLRPQADWAIPLDGLPPTPPPAYDQEKKILVVFSDWRQVVAFLVVLIMAGAIVYGVIRSSQQPARMDGKFNIAVAGIDMEAAGADSIYGPIISQQIASILRAELQAIDSGVQVSSDRMPRIGDEDDDAARALAKKVNADVVIFGEAEAVPGGDIRFTPHFYVNDTKHPNVYEVNGADFMEKALTVEKASLDKEHPDTAEIAARAALMTDFTQALVYLALDDLESAGDRIGSAIGHLQSDDALRELSGYEVIYLYASHIALMSHDLDLAEVYAARALETNRAYGRGYLALANIYIAERKYDQALQAYRDAAARSGQSQALVDEKAALGSGVAHMNRLLEENSLVEACAGDDRPQALAHFQAVIAAHNTTDEPDARLSAMAGKALAYEGRVHQACGDPAAAVGKYCAALSYPLAPDVKAETLQLLEDIATETSVPCELSDLS